MIRSMKVLITIAGVLAVACAALAQTPRLQTSGDATTVPKVLVFRGKAASPESRPQRAVTPPPPLSAAAIQTALKGSGIQTKSGSLPTSHAHLTPASLKSSVFNASLALWTARMVSSQYATLLSGDINPPHGIVLWFSTKAGKRYLVDVVVSPPLAGEDVTFRIQSGDEVQESTIHTGSVSKHLLMVFLAESTVDAQQFRILVPGPGQDREWFFWSCDISLLDY